MATIRPYAEGDYKEVKEILKEAGLFDNSWDSEENILGMIKKDTESVLVALEGSTIVGVLYTFLFGAHIAWLFRLAVKKTYRKHGIATLLIKHAELSLKKKGITEVGMYVNANEVELHMFYKKKDYRSSTNKSYMYMWKELTK